MILKSPSIIKTGTRNKLLAPLTYAPSTHWLKPISVHHFEFRHEDKQCHPPELQRVNYHLTVWTFPLNEGVWCLEWQIQRACQLLWNAVQLCEPLSPQLIRSIGWNLNIWWKWYYNQQGITKKKKGNTFNNIKMEWPCHLISLIMQRYSGSHWKKTNAAVIGETAEKYSYHCVI